MSLPNSKMAWVRGLKPSDLYAILYNYIKYLEEHDEDNDDAERTPDQVLGELARPLRLRVKDVEAALFAGNILNDSGKFYHPEGLTFEKFASRVVGSKYDFNQDYNLVEKI